MGLFTKRCEVCGQKIEKGNDVVRYGKHFDSEEHAEQYLKRIQETIHNSSDEHNHSCCCG